MTGWTHIGRTTDVPLLEGRSTTVLVPGTEARRIAVFRLPGGWAATDAACPHRGGPLSDGIVTASCVTCPLHQRRFDLVTGEQVGGTDRVLVHEIAERDGALWVRLAADADADAGEADAALREAA